MPPPCSAQSLVVGLATASDYGITVDEFNADDYGPKALAWYTSGFTDRSHFETVEFSLWYYGPWFHMLTAFVQSFELADRFTVRHAMTFLVGLAGLGRTAADRRLAVGRWAGLTAIALCLMTGYLYGSLFFTPIDVPFLAAMTWATLAILVMTRQVLPSWPATISAGLLTGLAIATRTGGIITHAYLLGAMTLCARRICRRARRLTARYLSQLGMRYGAVVIIAWLVAIALWPWLQIGNPFEQFKIGAAAFCDNSHVVRILPLGRADLDRCAAAVLHSRSAAGTAAGSISAPAGGRHDPCDCSDSMHNREIFARLGASIGSRPCVARR